MPYWLYVVAEVLFLFLLFKWKGNALCAVVPYKPEITVNKYYTVCITTRSIYIQMGGNWQLDLMSNI